MRDREAGSRGAGEGSPTLAILRDVALFAGLDEVHLKELVTRGGRRRFEPQETLFLQGQTAEGLYIVLAGRVRVFKTSSRGREQTLMIMGPGDPVGEVAVLRGENYPATAEALEPAEAFYMPRRAFLDLVSREPEVAMRLLAALSARLRSFASLIEDLSLLSVAERLAAHLLAMACEGDDEHVVELALSKAQLSAAVGTVPETLSRAFRQLSDAGMVETRGRQVHIKDRARLERMAGLKQ